MREASAGAGTARPYGRRAIVPALNVLLQIIRQAARIRGFVSHHKSGPVSCPAAIHLARFPRIVGRSDSIAHPQATRGKLRAHLPFLLFEAQIRNGLRKILHSKEHRSADGSVREADHSNAHCCEVAIQQIGAVWWRVHPAGVNLLSRWPFSNILRDHRVARAGLSRALFERKLARQLMRERVLHRHMLGVLRPQERRPSEAAAGPARCARGWPPRTKDVPQMLSVEALRWLQATQDTDLQQRAVQSEQFSVTRCDDRRDRSGIAYGLLLSI
jgi:hypothetical protein